MREFKEDRLPKKNLLSLQIDLSKFSPATASGCLACFMIQAE